MKVLISQQLTVILNSALYVVIAGMYLVPIVASFWLQSGYQIWYIFHYFKIIEYLMSYLPCLLAVVTFMFWNQSQFYSVICLISNESTIYSETDVPLPFL